MHVKCRRRVFIPVNPSVTGPEQGLLSLGRLGGCGFPLCAKRSGTQVLSLSPNPLSFKTDIAGARIQSKTRFPGSQAPRSMLPLNPCSTHIRVGKA